MQVQPVTSGTAENQTFYAATPGGQIQLSVVNEDVDKQFPIGAEIYVDFTPATSAT